MSKMSANDLLMEWNPPLCRWCGGVITADRDPGLGFRPRDRVACVLHCGARRGTQAEFERAVHADKVFAAWVVADEAESRGL